MFFFSLLQTPLQLYFTRLFFFFFHVFLFFSPLLFHFFFSLPSLIFFLSIHVSLFSSFFSLCFLPSKCFPSESTSPSSPNPSPPPSPLPVLYQHLQFPFFFFASFCQLFSHRTYFTTSSTASFSVHCEQYDMIQG